MDDVRPRQIADEMQAEIRRITTEIWRKHEPSIPPELRVAWRILVWTHVRNWMRVDAPAMDPETFNATAGD